MAKQVQAWQARDGSLHLSELRADVASALTEADEIAALLADHCAPPYADNEALKRDILERADLVIDLASLLIKARELQAKEP